MTYQESLVALSDDTRRQIYERIIRAPAPVGIIAQGFPVSRPAISQHLKVLSDAGLVVVQQKGNRRIYSADPQGLVALRQYLDGLWGDVLTAFSDSFKEDI
ncbi:metalloregulator ArsR/SmtB family transcription factor [Cognatishimia sp. WU-CL00825]|uniref:ArsR/SmtB family transcription factor n=1 Tax=Cognatishimia sp. WU-CL00825 TaxID=3127658 RepID=UPI003105B8FD